MATIRQRNGRWQAIIRRVDLKTTKTFDRKVDAQSWARAKERDADLGHMPGKMLGTLGPLIERYEKELWKDKRWGASKANELSVLKRDLGARPLTDITQAAVLGYVRGLSITPGGVATRLSYLKEVLRTSRDLWAVNVPLDQVEAAIGAAYRLSLAGKSSSRERRPKQDELDAIIAYGEGQTRSMIDLATVVRVLSTVPLRLSELLGIQWADLNKGRRSAVIRSRKHPDVLEKERNDQEVPLIAFGGVDAFDLVASRPAYLPSPFPYLSSSTTAAFAVATVRCKIDDLHLHDLRAHAISRLLEGGIPIPQVAILSGHRNWKILARHYSRIDPATIHETIRRAPSVERPDTPSPSPRKIAAGGPTS